MSAGKTFDMIQQNPSGESNPDISLQNMLSAQDALSEVDAIIAASSQVTTAIDKLEEALGGDSGMKQEVSNLLAQALQQNSAVDFLLKMSLLPSIETLFNQGEFGRVKTKITTDLQRIQSSQDTTQNAGQNAIP